MKIQITYCDESQTLLGITMAHVLAGMQMQHCRFVLRELIHVDETRMLTDHSIGLLSSLSSTSAIDPIHACDNAIVTANKLV